MESVVSVDPFRCRMWIAHDRLEEYITEDTCVREIESFKAHKQRKPAIGRPVHDDPACDVELFSGARRLFVARLLKVPLLVELRELSDRDAIVEMHVDRMRKDLSPYELGLAYLGWVRGRYFESQEEMSRVLRVSSSKVSRLIKMAKLPAVVVKALDAVSMRERWGLNLAKILENPQDAHLVIQEARRLLATTPRPSPKEAYRRLRASVAHAERGRRKLTGGDQDKVVLGRDSTPLFRIRQQVDYVALLLPIEAISANTLHHIQTAIQSILQDSGQKSELRRAEEGNQTRRITTADTAKGPAALI